MIMIIITTISIFIISGGVWTARKIWPEFKVCPVCAGVSGTWIWILIGIWIGLLDVGSWGLVVAMLAGGSVVGIAYQLEKRIGPERGMAWKMFFIPTGFVAVYGAISTGWLLLFISAAVISFLLLIFLKKPNNIKKANEKDEGGVDHLEKEMENCC